MTEKFFQELFFVLKKENYPISPFVKSLFSTKKSQEPKKSCQFATLRQNALFEFLTSQTGQKAFTIFKVIIR